MLSAKTYCSVVVFQHLEKNMHLDSPYFISTLVAVGHISQLVPGQYGSTVRELVRTFIVKDLIMQDRVCTFW